jgi:hypothetical protein
MAAPKYYSLSFAECLVQAEAIEKCVPDLNDDLLEELKQWIGDATEFLVSEVFFFLFRRVWADFDLFSRMLSNSAFGWNSRLSLNWSVRR